MFFFLHFKSVRFRVFFAKYIENSYFGNSILQNAAEICLEAILFSDFFSREYIFDCLAFKKYFIKKIYHKKELG